MKKKAPGWKPREKKPSKPPSFGVYFDESSKTHESGQVQFLFTAALVRESRKAELEAKYLSLRREMTEAVLQVAPELAGHKDIRGGLLEIHAVDLYQSKGIYNAVKKKQPDFWKKNQLRWLETALRYAHESGVKYFSLPAESETYAHLIGPGKQGLISHPSISKYKSISDRISRMMDNPYFLGLPFLLSEIDSYLKSVGGTASVYCHTNEETRGFSEISMLEYVQERQHLTTLSVPEFKTCSEEQAIQAADVAGYVLMQIRYCQQFNLPYKPEFLRWFKKYVAPNCDFSDYAKPTNWQNALALIVIETLLRSAKGTPEQQEALQKLARFAAIYTMEPSTFDQLRGWAEQQLKLAERTQMLLQTYKPPSEDGDLSKNTVAQEAEAVKLLTKKQP